MHRCREAHEVGVGYWVPIRDELDWGAVRTAASAVDLVMHVDREPWSAVFRVVLAGEERHYLVADGES